ncbi:MAG: metallophosphoesterase, partial [Planctomycetota bacterium]
MKKLLSVILISAITLFSQWSLILMPDTQYDIGAVFNNATNWIKNHVDSLNVKFVIHLGDITNHSNSSEWTSAASSMSALDGVVPYAMAVGNHDYDGGPHFSNFNNVFPISKYNTLPTWGGSMEPDKLENAYYYFSAGGTDYLILTLEFRANTQTGVMAWAESVVSAHPNRQVILDTHEYLNTNNTRLSSGQGMWDAFVKKYDNMFMVVCGHVENLGAGRLMSLGTNGNRVYQLQSNIQSLTYGAYYLRIMTFYPGANRITVKSFSPQTNKFWHDDELEFSIHTFDIDLANGTFVAPQSIIIVDTTAPTAPSNLSATGISESAIQISWDAAVDAESGIANYILKRDNVLLATLGARSYIDSGLPESTQYSYTVTAVNGAQLSSPEAGPVQGSTLTDNIKPTVVSVYPKPDQLILNYSEVMDSASVVNMANYSISSGIVISAITLSANHKTVTISTSDIPAGTDHTITINNVKDVSNAGNVIAANTQEIFNLPTSSLLVDFGATAGADQFELTGWNTAITDGYTNNVNVGPGGTAITTGSNGQYNYQGVTGPSTFFSESQKIVVTWYNNGSSSITFTPKISFTETGRPASGVWYNMTALTLAAGGTGDTEYELNSSTEGDYTVVNVSSFYDNPGDLICDKIALIADGATVGSSTILKA